MTTDFSEHAAGGSRNEPVDHPFPPPMNDDGPEPDDEPVAMPDGLRRKILIIDDSRATAKILERILQIGGYEAHIASNGPEGLARTGELIPDLILLDVDMPGMNGYEVCSRLKEDPRTRDIPVMFISAMGNEHKGLQLGAVDYIHKPFNKTVLKARIKNHLELKQYRDNLESLVRVRTEELEAANARLHREIVERRQAEELLKRSETYLRAVTEAIQTGLLIVDPATHRITDANPWAARMIGCDVADLLGRDYRNYVKNAEDATGCDTRASCDCMLERVNGDLIHVRKSHARAQLDDSEYIVQSLQDITDMKQMLKKQEINIELSRSILDLVNRVSPRYTRLGPDSLLFFDAVSVPCHKQGGDHSSCATFPARIPKPCSPSRTRAATRWGAYCAASSRISFTTPSSPISAPSPSTRRSPGSTGNSAVRARSRRTISSRPCSWKSTITPCA